jgi:hypothetical protein
MAVRLPVPKNWSRSTGSHSTTPSTAAPPLHRAIDQRVERSGARSTAASTPPSAIATNTAAGNTIARCCWATHDPYATVTGNSRKSPCATAAAPAKSTSRGRPPALDESGSISRHPPKPTTPRRVPSHRLHLASGLHAEKPSRRSPARPRNTAPTSPGWCPARDRAPVGAPPTNKTRSARDERSPSPRTGGCGRLAHQRKIPSGGLLRAQADQCVVPERVPIRPNCATDAEHKRRHHHQHEDAGHPPLPSLQIPEAVGGPLRWGAGHRCCRRR